MRPDGAKMPDMDNEQAPFRVTVEEWQKKRENAARSMYTDFRINLNDPGFLREWEGLEEDDKDRWILRADAAMRSLGFEKTNEDTGIPARSESEDS